MNIDITNYLRINPVDMALVCISTFIICLVAKHFFWDVILDYFQKEAMRFRRILMQEILLVKKENLSKSSMRHRWQMPEAMLMRF